MTLHRNSLFLIVSSVVVAAVVSVSLFIIGSPMKARMEGLDEQRVRDLCNITTAIDVYSRKHDGLPTTLEQLTLAGNWEAVRVTDPETKGPYEYIVRDDRSYDLCAAFKTVRAKDADDSYGNPFWNHGVGRTCFHVETNTKPGK